MILKLLKVDEESYEAMRLDMYMEWCFVMAKNNESQFQAYLANSAINKWFNQEYNQLEQEFATNVFIESKLETKAIRDYYSNVTNNIFFRFPQPLIKFYKIKNNKIK